MFLPVQAGKQTGKEGKEEKIAHQPRMGQQAGKTNDGEERRPIATHTQSTDKEPIPPPLR
eukprot:362472-Chlamydomonas_euryale.AAC.4